MTADLFALLTRASLDISAAVFVVLVLRRPARWLGGAVLAYRMWLLIPLAAVAIALPPPPAALSLLPRPAAQTPAASTLALDVTSLDGLPPSLGGVTPRPVRQTLTLRAARSLAVILWALGLAGVWTIILVRQRRYLRALGALTPKSGSPRVFLSAAPDVRPALIGSLRAFVVLPNDFHQRYDDQQSALILAHERTHLAQRHHLEGAFGLFLLTTQWFNPLAYLAYRAFRIDQELACDAVVMASNPGVRAAYAEAMLKSQLIGVSVPFACQWPSSEDHPFKERLMMLRSKAPSRQRGRLAGAALTLLLTTSVYVAYAAEPSAPDELPRDVIGVVGSGDRLGLLVRADSATAGSRTLKVGETYKDGWTLQALSDREATLAKGAEVRRIGLNPTGALAAEADNAPPSTIAIADPQIAAIIASENAAAACREDYARQGGAPYGPFRSEAEGEAWQAAALAKFGQAKIDLCFNGGMRRLQARQALSPQQLRSYYLQKGDTNAVRSMDHLAPIGPALIYDDPLHEGPDAAAQAVGLKSAMGYSYDMPPAPQTVMYKCWSPETPASVAYKCSLQY